MFVRGQKDECYYCKRKGKMVYVPDAQVDDRDRVLSGGVEYAPLWTCNRPDCADGGFYDLPYAELDKNV